VSGALVVLPCTDELQQDGALYGLDLATGAQRARLGVGASTRFAKPALGGGLLLPTRAGVTAVRLRS
jgi:hypothetical protein